MNIRSNTILPFANHITRPASGSIILYAQKSQHMPQVTALYEGPQPSLKGDQRVPVARMQRRNHNERGCGRNWISIKRIVRTHESEGEEIETL